MSAKGSNLDKAIDKGVKWLENYIDVSTKDVISVAVTGALGVGVCWSTALSASSCPSMCFVARKHLRDRPRN